MFLLENDRLRVSVAEPGERPADRTRFSHTGFITEVLLDHTVQFMANEPSNLVHPSSGGRGLCCEYTADFSKDIPVGAYFPRLGVGLIRKEDEQPFIFHRSYRDVRPYPVTVEQAADRLRFILTTDEPTCGIGMDEIKTVSISGCTLTVETQVRNVGDKPIRTKEYCHNFLSVDGMAVSPEYRLSMPALQPFPEGVQAGDPSYPTCDFFCENGDITFAKGGTAVSLMTRDARLQKETDVFPWKLTHTGARASVTGNDRLRPVRITLWAADHIVSPEIIQEIILQPDETFTFSRSMTFERETVHE